MERIFQWFIIILSQLSFAQNLSGIVEYKVISQITTDTISNQRTAAIFQNITNQFEKLSFRLEFNANESIFELNTILKSDNSAEKAFVSQAISIVEGETTYLNLAESKRLIIKKLFSDVFLVSDNLEIDWTIVNNSKEINGYECFKAEVMLKADKMHTKDRQVTAWFTNKIPVSHGPRGFAGLPGLILELQVDDIVFVANKITFKNKDEVKINAPKKGIKLTLQEYQDLVMEKIYEYGFEKRQ